MKKRFTTILLMALLTLVLCAGSLAEAEYLTLPEGDTPDASGVYRDLGNYLIELWYDEADYDAALAYAEARNGMDLHTTSRPAAEGGACTACAKLNREGEVLIGRNLDNETSLYPAFIIHTSFGKYDTVSIRYNNNDRYNYDEFRDHGYQDAEYMNYIPFCVTDAMNSEGMFVEANIREPIPDFVSRGIHPERERVITTMLVQAMVMNCATVQETLDYLRNEIDIVSTPYVDMRRPTQYAYMIGDATGEFGVIEIAKDEVFYLPFQPAQANFYLYPTLNVSDNAGSGYGRMARVLDGLQNVQTSEDMMEQMKKPMWKAEVLDMECGYVDENGRARFVDAEGNPSIDWRSDLTNIIPVDADGNITEEYTEETIARSTPQWMSRDDKFEQVRAIISERIGGWKEPLLKYYEGDEMPLRENGNIFCTGISYSVNCARKQMLVKFWEKENLIYRIDLG